MGLLIVILRKRTYLYLTKSSSDRWAIISWISPKSSPDFSPTGCATVGGGGFATGFGDGVSGFLVSVALALEPMTTLATCVVSALGLATGSFCLATSRWFDLFSISDNSLEGSDICFGAAESSAGLAELILEALVFFSCSGVCFSFLNGDCSSALLPPLVLRLGSGDGSGSLGTDFSLTLLATRDLLGSGVFFAVTGVSGALSTLSFEICVPCFGTGVSGFGSTAGSAVSTVLAALTASFLEPRFLLVGGGSSIAGLRLFLDFLVRLVGSGVSAAGAGDGDAIRSEDLLSLFLDLRPLFESALCSS